jgi:peptidyl-prolyl cis-trans isomerase C
MKQLFAAIAALAALPLFAQSTPVPAASPSQQPVAIVNGQTITAEQLNYLYDRLGTKMRQQYEDSGGKVAFLNNYIRKRLMVQEAIKHAFDQKPDVKADMQASAEAALFDRYVRDVVAQPIITDEEMKKFYAEHAADFAVPEKAKVRHIIIAPSDAGPNRKTPAEAQEKIQAIAAELHTQNVFPAGTDPDTVHRLTVLHFAEAAKKYSEDGSAASGGDLGWNPPGVFEPTFDEAAFHLKKGVISGIIQTKFGYHLILVEDKKPATTLSFEEAKPQIREFLMTQHAADVLEAVTRETNQLYNTSKIATFPQNIR